MPHPKRVVEPVHVARGTIPEELSLPSELEAVTNGTLANAVRQLSSLSKHAEDMFAELARDSRGLATRANSLQARIDRLAVKVTQLDSTVEEGAFYLSLQDIHMRKAFKSAVVFDQQVVSRDTMPTAMLETYKSCDKPPPLDKLNPYREDGKDGLKFYTDPDYFFDLWRQEMLKDTERMMHDKGKKPHRPRNEGGGGRHKKRVRQPHNTRERQRQIAVCHGEYIMPQTNHYRTPQIYQTTGILQEHEQDGDLLGRPSRPSSIELRRSYPADQPDTIYSPSQQHQLQFNPYPHQNHYGPGVGYDDVVSQYQSQQVVQQGGMIHYTSVTETTYTSPAGTPGGRGSRSSSVRPTQPPPAPPTTNTSTTSTPTICSAVNTPTRGRSISSGRDALPPPPPPPVDLPPASPPPSDPLPPPPPPSPPSAPPPPPPPPPLPSPPVLNGDVKALTKKIISSSPPKAVSPPKQLGDIITAQAVASVGLRPKPPPQPVQYDPRSDLLKAIRDGIKLRKVEKNEQKEGERTNALHDVASILARRVAVEFSDSDSASESEYDSEGWVEPEPSA